MRALRTSQKPTSLSRIFRATQIKAVMIALLCNFLFVGTTIFVLDSVIQKNLQQSAYLLLESIPSTTKSSNKEIHNTHLSALIKNRSANSISVFDNNQKEIVNLQTQESVQSFEHFINTLFFSQPIQFHFSTQLGDETVILQPRAKNYLSYYLCMLAAFTISLALTAICLSAYLRKTHRFLKHHTEPMILAIQDFHRTDYWPGSIYNPIREFEIFSKSFDYLLDKFESTKQNLSEQNHQLTQQARHDVLTRLPNRQYFQYFLNKKFHQNLNKQLVLLFIDNNKFKYINDTFGHQAGDAVLIETAKRLKKTLRDDAFVARLGGDEFAVVLEKIRSTSHLETICQRLIDSCFEPLIFNEQRIDFSYSVGASYGFRADNLDDLLHQADLAMYKAKESSRRWAIYTPQHVETQMHS